MPDATNLTEAQKQAIEAIQSGPQTTGEYLHFITSVWHDGGWVMIPLFLLTLYLYFEGASILLNLNRLGIRKTPQDVWQNWYNNPEKGKGHVGEVIRYVLAGGHNSDNQLNRIESVRQKIVPFVNQKLTLLTVLLLLHL
jgi:hypothetical protein